MRGGRTRGVALAIALLAFAAAGAASIAGSGDTKINRYKVGKFPIDLAVGDFNRDGRKDLAVTNFQSDPKSISILRGRRGGKFAKARTIPLEAGNQPDGIAVARFGSGRDQDLVVGTLGSAVLLFKGGSGASFSPSEPLAVIGGPRNVATGDFNRDGLTDIAASRQDAGDVIVWLGTGGMAFGLPDQNVGGGGALVAARLDADRRLDLASLDFLVDGVVVFHGEPGGTFGTAEPVMEATFPFSLAVADLDRDGRNDVIGGLVGDRPRLAVSRGLPGGSFAAPVTLTVGPRPMVVQEIAVTQLNRDRDPDLVLVGAQQGGIRAAHRARRRGGSELPARVLFLEGKAGVSLRRVREIRLAGNATSVINARFDGGGRDVAVTTYPADSAKRGKAVVIRNP